MNFIKKHYIVILLIILIIFHIANNILWIIKNQSPALWDMAGHQYTSIKIFDLLNPPSIEKLKVLGGYQSIYPPFVYLTTSVFYFVFGVEENMPAISSLVFVIILLLSTYGIGKKIYNDKVGLLASFFVSIYSLSAHFSRLYDLDYQLLAMATLTIYLLLMTDYFSNKKYSLLLGLITALGLLTKWTFIFFIIGPYLVILIKTLLSKNIFKYTIDKIKSLKYLIYSILITLIISIPWYIKHFKLIRESAAQTRNNIFSVPYENLISIQNIFYYFSRLLQSIQILFFILFLVGLIYLIFIKKYRNLTLITWFFIPYIIMTFLIYSKESRYILPVFPMVSIISALALIKIKFKTLKIILIIFFVITGFYYFIETSSEKKYLSRIEFLKPIFFSGYGYKIPTSDSPQYGYTYPVKFDSKIKEVILTIQNSKKNYEVVPKVAIVPNDIFFNSQQFNYYSALLKYKFDYSPSSSIRNSGYKENLKKADFIVTKTGSQGPKLWTLYVDKIIEMEANPENEIFYKEYNLIRTISRENNEIIKVYQKTNGQI